MRNNSKDETLKKNYIQKYQYLIASYERVKRGDCPQYRLVKDFYKAHGTCPQNFLKYYARYKQSGDEASLLPAKRGPRFKSRRTSAEIEQLVVQERLKGMNRYEIHTVLKPQLLEKTPSASCIYKINRRHNLNRLRPQMQEEKRKIIKTRAGELGHIDCHYLSKDMIAKDSKRYYLVCVIDSCTRIAWAEVVEDIKALTVMFGTLRCLNQISGRFNIQFEEVLTDNGPEFGTRESMQKQGHPFERLLQEMGIKHRYIRPYRPQTNGKVERFWRSLNEDLINGTHFNSIEHFKEELFGYIVYYNKLRPHQGLNGSIPFDFLQKIKPTSV
jgi:transposase InsO family protein